MNNTEKNFVNKLKDQLFLSSIYSDLVLIPNGTPEEQSNFLKDLHHIAGNLNPWYKSNLQSYSGIKYLISDFVEQRIKHYPLIEEGIFKSFTTYPELRSTYKISYSVLSQIKKLPHSYKYFLPLINCKKGISIKITDTLYLKSTSLLENPPTGYFQEIYEDLGSSKIVPKVGNTLTIVGTTKGYISPSNYKPTEIVEKAIFESQLVVGLLFVFNIIKTGYRSHDIGQKFIAFTDYQNNKLTKVSVDLELSQLLKNASMNEAIERFEQLQSLPILGINSIQDMFDPIQRFFRAYTSNKENEKDFATKIGNSIIWYLYGIAANDSKKSIVDLITSLEALVRTGDRDLKSPTIADMCSFLLSKNIEERQTISDRINEIYDIRNAIVHTGKAQITKGERKGIVSQEELHSDALFLSDKIMQLIQNEIKKIK